MKKSTIDKIVSTEDAKKEEKLESSSLDSSLDERCKRVEKFSEILFDNFLLPYKDINLKLYLDIEDKKVISNIRKEFPELLTGGRDDYISLPLIISTITKILTGEEMRFLSDGERNVCGVKFIK